MKNKGEKSRRHCALTGGLLFLSFLLSPCLTSAQTAGGPVLAPGAPLSFDQKGFVRVTLKVTEGAFWTVTAQGDLPITLVFEEKGKILTLGEIPQGTGDFSFEAQKSGLYALLYNRSASQSAPKLTLTPKKSLAEQIQKQLAPQIVQNLPFREISRLSLTESAAEVALIPDGHGKAALAYLTADRRHLRFLTQDQQRWQLQPDPLSGQLGTIGAWDAVWPRAGDLTTAILRPGEKTPLIRSLSGSVWKVEDLPAPPITGTVLMADSGALNIRTTADEKSLILGVSARLSGNQNTLLLYHSFLGSSWTADSQTVPVDEIPGWQTWSLADAPSATSDLSVWAAVASPKSLNRVFYYDSHTWNDLQVPQIPRLENFWMTSSKELLTTAWRDKNNQIVWWRWDGNLWKSLPPIKQTIKGEIFLQAHGEQLTLIQTAPSILLHRFDGEKWLPPLDLTPHLGGKLKGIQLTLDPQTLSLWALFWQNINNQDTLSWVELP